MKHSSVQYEAAWAQSQSMARPVQWAEEFLEYEEEQPPTLSAEQAHLATTCIERCHHSDCRLSCARRPSSCLIRPRIPRYGCEDVTCHVHVVLQLANSKFMAFVKKVSTGDVVLDAAVCIVSHCPCTVCS